MVTTARLERPQEGSGITPDAHAGRAAPRQGAVTTETLQRCLQGTQTLFSVLSPASPARLKEKTGNTGLHDCRPCSRPCGREWTGLGGARDEDPQLRAARTDHIPVSFTSCACKWTHHAAAPGTSRLKGAARRECGPAAHESRPPCAGPRRGHPGSSPECRRGQAAPRTYSGRATLTLPRSNRARGAQRRARGHTVSQRPARPLIQF